jgi:hypothetical protein
VSLWGDTKQLTISHSQNLSKTRRPAALQKPDEPWKEKPEMDHCRRVAEAGSLRPGWGRQIMKM